MNPVYVSAFAALAGSLIGGLTTFATAWATQRQQANVQWRLQEKTRRQELYQQFIEEASKLYVDAVIHDQAPNWCCTPAAVLGFRCGAFTMLMRGTTKL
jgi:membrane protein YqaA with SNARE-associated domain